MNIRQIAYLAGVSVATVSRCINQPEKVSEETRNHIIGVMKRVDYIPNPSAKSLPTGYTKTILCVIPTLCNEFFNQLVEGSQAVLREADYKVLVFSTDSIEDFWRRVDQRSVDGMIISGSGFINSEELRMAKIQVPYVLIENMEQSESPKDVTYVYSDDYKGVQMALEYLYREGNRVFGVISTSDTYLVTERRRKAVYDFFMEKKDCRLCMVKAHYADLQDAYDACGHLMRLEERPTAIFAFNDMMAIAAMRYQVLHGIRVPEDMEIMGFDDNPVASFVLPSLSTVVAPNYQLGESAARLLLEKLRGNAESKSVLFPVELKLRETTRNNVKEYRDKL